MQLLHYALIFSLSISFPGGVSRASKFADVKSAGDCWAHVSPVGQGNTGAGVIPGSESSTLSKEGVASGGGGVVERAGVRVGAMAIHQGNLPSHVNHRVAIYTAYSHVTGHHTSQHTHHNSSHTSHITGHHISHIRAHCTHHRPSHITHHSIQQAITRHI